MKVKFPAIMFYTKDWLSDDELQMCSLAARGMWIDMLCMMHQSEDRGALISNGKPWTDKQIVDRVACPDTIEERYAALAELRANGVARTNDQGAIYNARMVRDEEIRNARSNAGKQGGRGHQKGIIKQNESKTKANTKQITEDAIEDGIKKGDARGKQADGIYLAYPKHVGRGAAIKAIQGAMKTKPAEYLLARTSAYAKAVSQWPPADKQFVPHPATWFNQQRYDDDPQTWERVLASAPVIALQHEKTPAERQQEENEKAQINAQRARRDAIYASLLPEDVERLRLAVVGKSAPFTANRWRNADPETNTVLKAAIVAEYEKEKSIG